jgi:hypothetical protein
MDPVSSLLSGHVAGKLFDYVSSKFKTNVIERWTKRRAQKFFDEFCREVEIELGGTGSAKLDDILSHILEDEICTETLFDAYRRVSLTKSKELGPRIIGIVTAELVLRDRTADEIEDSILTAAENLSDDELLDYAKFVREQSVIGADESEKDVSFTENGDLKIKWSEEHFDSNWRNNDRVSIAPLNLDESLGRWASKIKSYGILFDDMQEREWEYQEDSERHIDQDGTVREISWWIYVPKEYLRLADLVDRVSSGYKCPT